MESAASWDKYLWISRDVLHIAYVTSCWCARTVWERNSFVQEREHQRDCKDRRCNRKHLSFEDCYCWWSVFSPVTMQQDEGCNGVGTKNVQAAPTPAPCLHCLEAWAHTAQLWLWWCGGPGEPSGCLCDHWMVPRPANSTSSVTSARVVSVLQLLCWVCAVFFLPTLRDPPLPRAADIWTSLYKQWIKIKRWSLLVIRKTYSHTRGGSAQPEVNESPY